MGSPLDVLRGLKVNAHIRLVLDEFRLLLNGVVIVTGGSVTRQMLCHSITCGWHTVTSWTVVFLDVPGTVACLSAKE